MSYATLSVENLVKSYAHRRVVNDVSFYLHNAEIVGLLGPNGAGKTTSFYMTTGLVRADQGKIMLNDQNISQLPMHERARLGIGYLPQEASIFRRLTVWQNLLAVLELDKTLSTAVREAKITALLEEFHISHLKDALGASLSGGERRRVEIARAIALKPQFMLLDEPFAGIDPISIIDIKRIIHQLKDRGIGILITDHNVRETLDICERAYIMSEGKVIADGTPQIILKNQLVRDVYLGEEFDL